MRILVTLTILAFILNASHVSWYGNFDEAHKVALREDKKLMVLLIKRDSKEVQETIKTTFMNQSYIDKINNKFISVIVTKNQKSSYPIEMLYTLTYPTLFFLDNRELFICSPMRGEITPDKLKSYLEQYK